MAQALEVAALAMEVAALAMEAAMEVAKVVDKAMLLSQLDTPPPPSCISTLRTSDLSLSLSRSLTSLSLSRFLTFTSLFDLSLRLH